MKDDGLMSVRLRGPAVTMDGAAKVGQQLANLINAVATELGAPVGTPGVVVTGVYFQCDGCELRRPDRPGPEEGWTHVDGDDFCPTCSQARKESS